MIKISFCLLSLLVSLKVYSYPQVLSWKNSPIIAFDNKKNAILKKNEILKSPFIVVTANADELQLGFGDLNNIFIKPKSKVQIPEVFERADSSHEIFIFDGEVRLQNMKTKQAANLNRVKSAFFDLKQPIKADAIIHIDMKIPSVEIKVIEGEWPLEFFSYEKKVTLKAGQRITFTGVINESGDGILYDYLLENRKTPKGKMGVIQKFDLKSFTSTEKKTEQSEKLKIEQAHRAAIEAEKKKKAYEDSFLCKKPFAQKDQCAWWIDEKLKKCFRKRCNVSGEWGDLIERPSSPKCTSDFSIGECDY